MDVMLNNSIMNIDLSGLRNFYKSDATALHILESLGARQNNWKKLTTQPTPARRQIGFATENDTKR
jgi:hypothetical protein